MTDSTSLGSSFTNSTSLGSPMIDSSSLGTPFIDSTSQGSPMIDSTSQGSPMTDSISLGFPLADSTSLGSPMTDSTSLGFPLGDSTSVGSPMTDSTSVGSPMTDFTSVGSPLSDSTALGSPTTGSVSEGELTTVESVTLSWTQAQNTGDFLDFDPAWGQRLGDSDLFNSTVNDTALGQSSSDNDIFSSSLNNTALGQRSDITVHTTDPVFPQRTDGSDLFNGTVSHPTAGVNDGDLFSFTDSVTYAASTVAPQPDVIISAEVYAQAVDVMNKLMYALQVTGLLLNIVSIVVFTRRRLRSPTTTLLVAISVLQLLYIVIRVTEDIYSIFCTPSLTNRVHLIYGIYIHNYCLTCLRRSLLGLQGLVSMERLLAVAYPLRAKQFLLVRRPSVFVFAWLALVFTVHVHICFKLEIYQEETEPGNGTHYSYRYTETYLRYSKMFDTAGIFIKCIFVYLALLVLLVANVAILIVLRRHAGMMMQIQSGVSTPHKRDNQMTMTILVSTFIFIVLSLPTVSNSLVYNVFPHGYGPFTGQRHLFLFVQQFGSVCFVLSFSTDFITYVALSSVYRNTLLFKCRHG